LLILDEVILINEFDQEIGTANKLEAHLKGFLHRAISVFIINSKGEYLLQQRANQKYHSPGLWSNTCCSHPKPKENNLDAANRRLYEEMGISCELKFSFSFQYKIKFENGLIENEFDHVFVGKTDKLPVINPREVMNWKYLSETQIKSELKLYPEKYTYWFPICITKINEIPIF
jgi:isopentenyl-diphosphate delta-isomerase